MQLSPLSSVLWGAPGAFLCIFLFKNIVSSEFFKTLPLFNSTGNHLLASFLIGTTSIKDSKLKTILNKFYWDTKLIEIELIILNPSSLHKSIKYIQNSKLELDNAVVSYIIKIQGMNRMKNALHKTKKNIRLFLV